MPADTSFDLLTTQLRLAPDGSATPLRPICAVPSRHRRDTVDGGVDRIALTVRVGDEHVLWTRCPSGDVVLCLLAGAVDVLLREPDAHPAAGRGEDPGPGGVSGGGDGTAAACPGTEGAAGTVARLRAVGGAVVVPEGHWYGLRGSPSGHVLTLTPFEPPRRPDQRGGDGAARGRHAAPAPTTTPRRPASDAPDGLLARGGDGDRAAAVGPALFALADSLWPHAVRVAATLRLADRLAARPRQVGDLAEECAVDADALGRLLGYLASRGVFRRTGRTTFALNGAARLLCDDHPTRLRAWLDVDSMGGRVDRAAAGLLDTVRTGEPAYPKIFGRALWDDLAAAPDLVAAFNRYTAARTSRWAADVLAGYDWSRARHVVDVGGGDGTLLARILTAHPTLVGTLVDLPKPAAAAGEALAAAGLADRCAVVAGSFFDPLPTTGDVYLLANVVSAWADRDAVAILRRCAQAAGADGRVLVVERNAPDEAESAALDLTALVLLGGRLRDLDALGSLAVAAGMRVRSAVSTPGGVSMVECLACAD